MRQVAENIYQITQFMVTNYYVVITRDGLIVIDTGYDDRVVRQLSEALGKIDHDLSDIRYILITHEHPDHIGGLAALQAATHARTIAHQDGVPYIHGEQPLNMADPATLSGLDAFIYGRMSASPLNIAPATVDRVVTDGDTLDDILPGLQVVHLPGHADGQAGYWLPQGRVLFGGDVAGNYPIIGLQKPLRPAAPDWSAVVGSMQKAAALGPQLLLLGHINPVRRDVAAALNRAASQ
jgi:glyoxylase-like metal-dependent hydrolase (beta-lactamase superfamily II)